MACMGLLVMLQTLTADAEDSKPQVLAALPVFSGMEGLQEANETDGHSPSAASRNAHHHNEVWSAPDQA